VQYVQWRGLPAKHAPPPYDSCGRPMSNLIRKNPITCERWGHAPLEWRAWLT